MAKNESDDPNITELMFETFKRAPWYVGPLVAAFVYGLLKWFVPWAWPFPAGEIKRPEQVASAFAASVALSGPILAPFFGGIILFAWMTARIMRHVELKRAQQTEPKNSPPQSRVRTQHNRADKPANTRGALTPNNANCEPAETFKNDDVSVEESDPVLETPHVAPSNRHVPTAGDLRTVGNPIDISNMTWQQFEKLLVGVLRRLGFKTEHTGRSGPDGGFDVRCTDSKGRMFLVQCKHWKHEQVNVKVVREFLGVLVHEDATSGLIVTSGLFTQDAKKFAEEKALRLIDGENLLKVLSEIPEYRDGEKLRYRISHLESVISSEPCPRCAGRMIRKNGRRGTFLSCERYPDCEGSRNV